MTDALTLYSFVPFDRGSRVRWTALELGLAIDEQRLEFSSGKHKSEEFRALNPFGVIPAARWRGHSLWDSVGICQYLVEQHPQSGLAPALDSPMRPSYLSWLFFATSSLDSGIFAVFYSAVLNPDAAKREQALNKVKPNLEILNAHMNGRDFVLGAEFTLPDVLIGHGMLLLKMSKALGEFPQLREYMTRLAARPAARSAGLFGG